MQPVIPAPELSVVIPCYNEADAIENTVLEWSTHCAEHVGAFEIVIVNDGSTDGSGRILDRLRKEHSFLRVLHQLNMGHDAAVRRGYEMAKGKFIVQIDGNGRNEPAEFVPMWERREAFRLILGHRAHRLDSLVHRMLGRVMRRVIKAFFKVELVDPNAPFRLVQRHTALSALRRLPSGATAIDLLLSVLIQQEYPGEVCEVPVPYRPRTLGLRRARFTEHFARATRYLGELIALRFKGLKYEIPTISPRTVTVRA